MVTTHYMDEAELCQRVGFISQGRLIALDTPERLKRTHMHGHVLELDCGPDSEAAVRALRAARQSRTLDLDEIALYGAQIHVIVPDASIYTDRVVDLLHSSHINVRAVDWIAPTLEDVFISAVKAAPNALSGDRAGARED